MVQKPASLFCTLAQLSPPRIQFWKAQIGYFANHQTKSAVFGLTGGGAAMCSCCKTLHIICLDRGLQREQSFSRARNRLWTTGGMTLCGDSILLCCLSCWLWLFSPLSRLLTT